MMKRKMGLSFNLFSKSHKSKTAIDGWPDDEDETDSPLEGIFVNRPPPLDPKTEHDLRKACAIVLQDLKPSGYDVEDTRMRSDMLVEDSDDFDLPQQAAPSKGGKRSQPLVAQQKTVEDRNESHPGTLDPGRQVKPVENKRHSRQLPSFHTDSSSARPNNRTTNRPPQLDLLPSLRPPDSFDAPYAPAPTTVDSTHKFASPVKQPRATESIDRPLTTKRMDSSSTLSSMRYSNNSTNDLQGSSTGFTSAHFTPDVNSKRMSAQALADTGSSSKPDAAISQWMKEEAERRRQADSAQSEGAFKPLPTTVLAAGQPTDLPDAQSSYTQSRSMTPDTRRDSQLSFSRPRSSGGQNQPTVQRKRTEESPAVSERSASTAQSHRLSTDPSQYQSSTKIPPNKVDSQVDRPLTPSRSKEMVPPVPRLTQAQAEQALNSKPNSKPTSPLSPSFPVTTTSIMKNQPVSKSLDNLNERSASLTSPTFSSTSQEALAYKDRSLADSGKTKSTAADAEAPPIPPKARHMANRSSTSQKYQLLPIKHHDDESIMVKDFWKPSLRPTVNKATSKQTVPTIDVNAIDFDQLMTYMRDNEEENAISRGQDESSRTGSLLGNGKPVVLPPPSPRSNNTQSPLSPTFPPPVEMRKLEAETPIVTKLEKTSSRTSSRNGANGVTSPPHSSQGPSLLTGKENKPSSSRGFKRFFGRDKTNGVWIPPAGPQYVTQEVDEEEWYDDQACAAPVIGFGRGW